MEAPTLLANAGAAIPQVEDIISNLDPLDTVVEEVSDGRRPARILENSVVLEPRVFVSDRFGYPAVARIEAADFGPIHLLDVPTQIVVEPEANRRLRLSTSALCR